MEMKVKNKQIKKPAMNSRAAKALTLAGPMGLSGLVAGCRAPTDAAKCECAEKMHLDEGETCNCGAGVCDCTTKYNGTISKTSIKVWKEVGVSELGYDYVWNDFTYLYHLFLTPENQASVLDHITEIRAKPKGTGISLQGTVLSIGCDDFGCDYYMGDYFVDKNIITHYTTKVPRAAIRNAHGIQRTR